ncbi:MAG: ABC transporter ATP-binding protein [Firmicutes bacterium]|nr:ABC transporter ATP-binding protein [Bacillota bacterium]
MPRLKGMAGANRPERNNSSLWRVIQMVVKNYPKYCIYVLCLIILSAIINIYGSIFLQSLIDDYITPLLNQPEPDFGPLIWAILRLACIYICGVLAAYTWNRLMITVAGGTLRDIRDSLFEHMESLPIGYFDTHPHGDIMSVYTNDTDTLRQLISQSIPNLISSCITIIGVGFSMIVMNFYLSLITFAMAAIMLYITKVVTSKSGRYFIKQQQALGNENGFIEEMMEGAKVIKVFTHEKQSIEDFEKINDHLCDCMTNANTYANILMPILGNIGYASYALTAIVGSVLAINGLAGLTLGTIAAFLQLNRSFNNPISQISQQLNAVVMAGAGATRVFEIIDAQPEVDEGKITLVSVKPGTIEETEENTGAWCWRHPRLDGSVDYVPLEGDVQFFDVDFGYVPEKVVLHDINLYAQPGQKVAFVGSTGAGKTTITNLINRFYDIQNGMITYDGIDVKLIKKESLRRSLGIVLQDVNLFTGTIMDNIRYGKLSATDEECIAAAKLANADGFIRHLEHGYNTMITGNGESLSQGQRQLLSIARAAVANPAVLILDEATSSIDTRTEKIVQDGMDKLMEGRTVFVIAHRLSTIQNSDAIMVLEQGRIIERGSHDALIEKKGTYYQLYTGAFELD